MPHSILLAEDDARLATLVKDYLESTGEFRVMVQGNGGKVLRAVEDLAPDLVILDVGLPNKDGLSICRDLRPSFQGPILILTARGDDAEQILGLEHGADDYVVKPVEPRLLLARIRALLRRYDKDHKSECDQLNFGNLQIHCPSRTVTLQGQSVELSSHEFDLLLALAKQPGHTMSREYLYNCIYSRPYDGVDRTIDVRISQLRRKLGDSADTPFRIKTIWGRGYLFAAEAWEE
jgi:DNA-binding response OmpR family regulator